MSEWTPHVLTAAGRRLQAKVEAGLTPLALTRMKLGSGLETIDEVDNLVDLVAPEVSFPISSATVKGDVCTVLGVFSTANIEHGFYCREWGIFAEDPDEGEILYAILIDEKYDSIPANLPTELTITFALNIVIANGTAITARIGPAGLVDVDMLNAYTHSVTRMTQYKEGDVLKLPTLPHGLVLECQSGGETDEILPDVSGMAVGDTLMDGTVLWQAKRLMLAPSAAYYYKPEWIYEAIGRLVSFGQSVKKTAAKIVADNGETFYLGGAAMDVDIDEILIPSDRYAGTVFLYYTAAQPLAAGFAWIKCDDIEGEIVNARPTFLLDDGSRIGATKAKVTRSDGLFYYVDTVSREPITTSGAYSYEIATEDDIDEIIDRLGGEQDG
ncbi:MAG: hypothetical protein IJ741_03735 [Schwartzia sp.]|nr:hypothetical protein [Schwartzia sp. (in: firmicutes)]